jgi:hypothetical protein
MLFAAMGLLVFSTVLIALVRQWRALTPALLAYACALALAEGAALGPLAGVVVLVGSLSAVTVLLRGAAARAAGAAAGLSRGERLPPLVTLGELALAVLGAYALTVWLPLGGSTVLNFAWYWLLVVGLVVLVGAQDLLRTGLGLIVMLGAGIVLQAGLAPSSSIAFVVACGIAQVSLALGVVRVVSVAVPGRREGV